MELFEPEYYRTFHCIASACPDSCCKEWEVDIDQEAAAFYRSLPGPLGEKLRRCLREEPYGTVMTIENGRCPMWRADGLCRIHAELGHEALCQVCRDFPRLRHDYGNFAELGLELSCPEAARLIFASQEYHFHSYTVPGGEEPEYDPEIMEILLKSRREVLDFLKERNYSMPEALAITLLYGHSVQSALDGGDYAPLDPEDCLAEALKYVQPADHQAIFDFFSSLEILTPQWKARLAAGAVNFSWTDSLRPLLRYGIQRYWLQAVSDYDLVCRVKFIIAACLIVNAMGGNPVETSQLFSKEIENDPDNLEAILDGSYTSPALTDTTLLGLIFQNNHN